MNLEQALKKLNIEDYKEAIFNSSSRGELFFISDYLELAQRIPDNDVAWFRPAFLKMVEIANKEWRRPQSVYQHVLRVIFTLEPDRMVKLFPENVVYKD